MAKAALAVGTYNYDDGKTYHLKITKDSSGKLTLRASIDKLGMMGQTLTWTPLTQAQIAQYDGREARPKSCRRLLPSVATSI